VDPEAIFLPLTWNCIEKISIKFCDNAQVFFEMVNDRDSEVEEFDTTSKHHKIIPTQNEATLPGK